MEFFCSNHFQTRKKSARCTKLIFLFRHSPPILVCSPVTFRADWRRGTSCSKMFLFTKLKRKWSFFFRKLKKCVFSHPILKNPFFLHLSLSLHFRVWIELFCVDFEFLWLRKKRLGPKNRDQSLLCAIKFNSFSKKSLSLLFQRNFYCHVEKRTILAILSNIVRGR